MVESIWKFTPDWTKDKNDSVDSGYGDWYCEEYGTWPDGTDCGAGGEEAPLDDLNTIRG